MQGVTSGRKSAPHFIITERIAFVCLIIKRREHRNVRGKSYIISENSFRVRLIKCILILAVYYIKKVIFIDGTMRDKTITSIELHKILSKNVFLDGDNMFKKIITQKRSTPFCR